VWLVYFDCFIDLVADFEDWVESVHRALENDRDPFPADLSDLGVAHLDEVFAVEEDLSFTDLARAGE